MIFRYKAPNCDVNEQVVRRAEGKIDLPGSGGAPKFWGKMGYRPIQSVRSPVRLVAERGSEQATEGTREVKKQELAICL